MRSHFRASAAAVQSSCLELVPSKGEWANVPAISKAKRANATVRCHTVPSTLKPPMRAEIASAVSAGRSVAQTAKEYNADRCVVTEIWLREEMRKLRAEVEMLRGGLRRAA